MNGALPEAARDVALLVARIVLGVVLFARGWHKVVVDGVAATSDQFEALGIPAAIVSSSFVAFVEFVGGALLVVGALTPVVAGLHLVVMIGAAAFVHVSTGIFTPGGGFELVSVIAAAELVLAACGAGRFSVDRLLAARLRRGPATAPPAEAVGAPAGGRHEKLDAEPVTSAFPVVTGANFAVQPAVPPAAKPAPKPAPKPDAPMFGEPPPTSALPEQKPGRRIPRPITPLLGRADLPRRSDPRDRPDDATI